MMVCIGIIRSLLCVIWRHPTELFIRLFFGASLEERLYRYYISYHVLVVQMFVSNFGWFELFLLWCVWLISCALFFVYCVQRLVALQRMNAIFEELLGEPSQTMTCPFISKTSYLRALSQCFKVAKCHRHPDCSIYEYWYVFNIEGRSELRKLFSSHEPSLERDRYLYLTPRLFGHEAIAETITWTFWSTMVTADGDIEQACESNAIGLDEEYGKQQDSVKASSIDKEAVQRQLLLTFIKKALSNNGAFEELSHSLQSKKCSITDKEGLTSMCKGLI